MLSEWQTLTLAQAGITLIDCDHRTPPPAPHGYPYIAIPQLKDGHLDLADVRLISEEHFADWTRKLLPKAHDVIVVRRCNSGDSAVVPEGLQCAIGQNLVVLRADGTYVRPRFLRWLVRGDQWWEQVRKYINVGAVFDSLKCRDIPNFELLVPPTTVQDQICDSLEALDDRITLLRRTNATFESIARAIFKSWFINFDPVRAKADGREPEGLDAATAALFPAEFEESELGLIPKGWQVAKLGDICGNPRVQAKPDHVPPETPYIGLEHMPRKSIALDASGTAEGLGSAKFWFERDDVLFGKLRPYFHKVGLAPRRGICSTDILVLRPTTPDWLGFLAMHASSDALIAHTTQHSNGARMPRTSWQDIHAFKVALPPARLATAFNEVVTPLFERLYVNIELAAQLSQARDALLPRLMSGTLRLPEAQEQPVESLI